MKDTILKIIICVLTTALVIAIVANIDLMRRRGSLQGRAGEFIGRASWTEIYSCGSCGYLTDTKWNFCPVCGSDNR